MPHEDGLSSISSRGNFARPSSCASQWYHSYHYRLQTIAKVYGLNPAWEKTIAILSRRESGALGGLGLDNKGKLFVGICDYSEWTYPADLVTNATMNFPHPRNFILVLKEHLLPGDEENFITIGNIVEFTQGELIPVNHRPNLFVVTPVYTVVTCCLPFTSSLEIVDKT